MSSMARRNKKHWQASNFQFFNSTSTELFCISECEISMKSQRLYIYIYKSILSFFTSFRHCHGVFLGCLLEQVEHVDSWHHFVVARALGPQAEFEAPSGLQGGRWRLRKCPADDGDDEYEWMKEGGKEGRNELISYLINQMHKCTKETMMSIHIAMKPKKSRTERVWREVSAKREPEGGQNQEGGQGPWRKMILRVENRNRRSEERGEPKAESWQEGEEGKGRNQSAF